MKLAEFRSDFGNRLLALRKYVPEGFLSSVLMPRVAAKEWSVCLSDLGKVRYYDEDTYSIDVNANEVVFVVPPSLPANREYYDQAQFTALSERYACLCASLNKWVAVDTSALRSASLLALAPPNSSAARKAALLIEWLGSKQRIFSQSRIQFPLPRFGWEVELGDLSTENMCQAPSGEIFTHLDSKSWNGVIDLATGSSLKIANGVIIEASHAPWSLGKPICEIGFGLHPNIAGDDGAWGEKANGTVHIGIGVSLSEDILPPTVHFDVLIDPAKELNREFWRVGSD